MKYGRKTIYTPKEDGIVHIRKESYGSSLNQVTEEIRETFKTSNQTFNHDLANALQAVNMDTDHIELIIERKNNTPYKITRTYLVTKKKV